MKILKISNLLDSYGTADYKGIDLNKIIPGSQLYPQDGSNTAYLKYNSNTLPSDADLTEITEDEYNQIKTLIDKNKPQSLEDRVELVEKAIDDIILNGGAL